MFDWGLYLAKPAWDITVGELIHSLNNTIPLSFPNSKNAAQSFFTARRATALQHLHYHYRVFNLVAMLKVTRYYSTPVT